MVNKIIKSLAWEWKWIPVVWVDWQNVWCADKIITYTETVWDYLTVYFCSAEFWTSITESKWNIVRIRSLVSDDSFFDKQMTWKWFDKSVDDLATVSWYSYN